MGQISTNTGIPQGSPLSPILYLFYNMDLIDWIHTTYPGRAMVTGYIDDIYILVWTLGPVCHSQLPALKADTPNSRTMGGLVQQWCQLWGTRPPV